jgi:hypothetical protein
MTNTMALTLRYGEDPVTGLPRLEDPGAALSAADRDALEGVLSRQFERLASGPDGQLLTLDGEVGPSVPRQFRITVTEREKRCPTLLLEAVEPPHEANGPPAAEQTVESPSPAAPGRWQAEFLAELAELLAGAGREDRRSPLDFVLADLRALLRRNPHRFALLLFAGYLHVGDALSRRYGEGDENRYARAARALVESLGDSTPEGALAPLLPATEGEAMPAPQRESWLRRFFSFC